MREAKRKPPGLFCKQQPRYNLVAPSTIYSTGLYHIQHRPQPYTAQAHQVWDHVKRPKLGSHPCRTLDFFCNAFTKLQTSPKNIFRIREKICCTCGSIRLLCDEHHPHVGKEQDTCRVPPGRGPPERHEHETAGMPSKKWLVIEAHIVLTFPSQTGSHRLQIVRPPSQGRSLPRRTEWAPETHHTLELALDWLSCLSRKKMQSLIDLRRYVRYALN